MDKLSAMRALDDWRIEGVGVSVSENTDTGLLRMQVFSRANDAAQRLGDRLGLTLPGPGETLSEAARRWYWAAPGEWIIAVETGAEAGELAYLRQQAGGLVVAVNVITDSRVVLELRGTATSGLLSRGSTVDFDPHVFTPGRCLTTRFAGLTVMLARATDGECVFLFADRSHADYLARWIEAASVGC